MILAKHPKNKIVFLGLDDTDVAKLKKGAPMPIKPDQTKGVGLGETGLIVFQGANDLTLLARLEEFSVIPEGAADAHGLALLALLLIRGRPLPPPQRRFKSRLPR